MAMSEGTTKKLSLGLVGISIEAITAGDRGWCAFPTGEVNQYGFREYQRYKIRAIEDIREKRNVMICDDQNGCKEHTPVELSYQSRAGPYQRVTENFPLPVTMGSKDSTKITHYTKQITANGNTLLVEAPDGDTKIRVHYYMYSNEHIADVRVGLRFATDGDIKHQAYLANQGGSVNANLVDVPFEGDAGEDLYGNLGAAAANGVWVTVVYSTEEV